MTRKLSIGIALLALAFTLFLVVDEYPYYRRPPGVPSTATRMDEKGWRMWVDCTPSISGEPNSCTMYVARTGEIEEHGQFVIRGTSRGANRGELHILYFDGTSVRLKNGMRLDPVTGTGPP